uniref:CCHC-type domain-containing protein n=1 Tax=Lactuca sativa TaxID=4236 RepID=A0A9R1XXW0_LACSA|nr:hypothetical protein LSAT_V11C100043400 [Lactuca sativa]
MGFSWLTTFSENKGNSLFSKPNAYELTTFMLISNCLYSQGVTTAVLAHRCAISASNVDVGVEDSDRSINPGSHQTVTVTGSQSRKTKNKKRKRRAQKERKKSQRLVMQPQQVETPAIPVQSRPYEGKLPKCGKCSFHHHGAFHEMQCCNCLKIGHHARSCGSPARPITQAPNIRVNQAYDGGVKTRPYERKISKWMNNENTRVPITPTRHFTSSTDVGVVQICHQCGEIGHLNKDCPITHNSGADGKILRITAAREPAPEPR